MVIDAHLFPSDRALAVLPRLDVVHASTAARMLSSLLHRRQTSARFGGINFCSSERRVSIPTAHGACFGGLG